MILARLSAIARVDLFPSWNQKRVLCGLGGVVGKRALCIDKGGWVRGCFFLTLLGEGAVVCNFKERLKDAGGSSENPEGNSPLCHLLAYSKAGACWLFQLPAPCMISGRRGNSIGRQLRSVILSTAPSIVIVSTSAWVKGTRGEEHGYNSSWIRFCHTRSVRRGDLDGHEGTGSPRHETVHLVTFQSYMALKKVT